MADLYFPHNIGAPHILRASPADDERLASVLVRAFDPERDMKALDSGVASEVHQQNPDISAFVKRGGKLLLWHGFNDPGPSPLSTIAYLDAVQKKVPASTDSVRLFLAPGVLHCGGGSGPNSSFAYTLRSSSFSDRTPATS